MSTTFRSLAVLISVALLAGCGGSSPNPSSAAAAAHRASGTSTPIQHVVIIMQENRSFENLFHGFPGANTVSSGVGHGTTYTLQPIPLKWKYEMTHSHYQFLEDFDGGKGDGFDEYITSLKKTGTLCSDPVNRYNEPPCWVWNKSAKFKQMAFSYVQQSDIQPYWTMAQQYALGDNTFSSNNGPTFESHQYLVAGESGHTTEVPNGQPWGCDGPASQTANVLAYGQANPPVFSAPTGHEIAGPFPCFTYPTLAQNLDANNITWKYYAQQTGSGRDLEPFEANKTIWDGADKANIVYPDKKVLTDIKSGNLPQVAWVTPSGSNSDHPGPQSGDKGPSWVGSIVNAIGESKYWNSTAIIIMWDEWGGWFDEVIPPQLTDPATGAYEGLGFRVPLIVVSPYARAGYVSHDQHEIAGTLKLIEETFGLPTIGSCSSTSQEYADCRADGFDDMFDFTQKPIPFVPIKTTYDAHYFLTHTDNTPGDTY
jgi:phospholipase C